MQWAKHFANILNSIICPFVLEGYKSRSFSHFGAIFIECGLDSEKDFTAILRVVDTVAWAPTGGPRAMGMLVAVGPY